MSSWILRTFKTRDSVTLITLWKTLVIPIHDYCSQLWSPKLIKHKMKFEQVQYQYLKKIDGMRNKSYQIILLSLFKMYPLERRRDRYIIIYIWKQLEHLVPKCNIIEHHSERRGRLLQTSHTNKKNNINSSSFTKFAPMVWNILPCRIRNYSAVNITTFKKRLDRFLNEIIDYPHIPNRGPRCCDNDLVTAIGYKMEDDKRMGRAPLSTKF